MRHRKAGDPLKKRVALLAARLSTHTPGMKTTKSLAAIRLHDRQAGSILADSPEVEWQLRLCKGTWNSFVAKTSSAKGTIAPDGTA